MTAFVVDASVAVKWYVPEQFDVEARRVRRSGSDLHAPDFLEVEVAAIFWKKLRRGEISRIDADDSLADLTKVAPLFRHPTGPLIAPAFDLADRTGRTVYDCLYLALAVRLGGTMVTADERLVTSLAATPWSGSIIMVGKVP